MTRPFHCCSSGGSDRRGNAAVVVVGSSTQLAGLLIHKIPKEGTFFRKIMIKLFPSCWGHLVPVWIRRDGVVTKGLIFQDKIWSPFGIRPNKIRAYG